MSANLFKKVNSSDYISYKKRTAIAGEYAKSANTNPMKTNGSQYNKTFKFIPTLNGSSVDISNCLIYAQNYDLFQDYTNGLKYIQKICDASGNSDDVFFP